MNSNITLYSAIAAIIASMVQHLLMLMRVQSDLSAQFEKKQAEQENLENKQTRDGVCQGTANLRALGRGATTFATSRGAAEGALDLQIIS